MMAVALYKGVDPCNSCVWLLNGLMPMFICFADVNSQGA